MRRGSSGPVDHEVYDGYVRARFDQQGALQRSAAADKSAEHERAGPGAVLEGRSLAARGSARGELCAQGIGALGEVLEQELAGVIDVVVV